MLKSVCFGFLAACGISLMLDVSEYNAFLSNNAINVIVFLAYVWIYGQIRMFKKIEKRHFWYGMIFCVILSCLLAFGVELEINGEIGWHFLTLARVVCLVFSIYPLVNVALLWIDGNYKQRSDDKKKSLSRKNGRKS